MTYMGNNNTEIIQQKNITFRWKSVRFTFDKIPILFLNSVIQIVLGENSKLITLTRNQPRYTNRRSGNVILFGNVRQIFTALVTNRVNASIAEYVIKNDFVWNSTLIYWWRPSNVYTVVVDVIKRRFTFDLYWS
jgi:hypothetical protein